MRSLTRTRGLASSAAAAGEVSNGVICGTCGTLNEVGRKFCKECAARLTLTCATCGTANSPDAKFCGECAAPLSSAAPSGASDAARPGSSASLPEAAGSERRIVSVLFADLVGFTPFAEERDAEDVRETLGRYFELASAVVDRYGGKIEKFIGDAVMAVWGAPVARENDAELAVRAALDLVAAVAGTGGSMSARAAVLTGEAAVTIGALNQGMVAGDLVNTAARLQGVADPGTVLVGEATMRSASDAILFEAATQHSLKGKSMPVPAYVALRVVAEVGGRGRSDVIEPPFVGRDTDFRLLKELLETTGRDRRARLATITGPAGIGKSRLVWEVEKYVDGVVEPIYWNQGRSPSYGQSIAFWALGEMVRRRAGLAEQDDESTTRTKVTATVMEYVGEADDRRWVEPALLALLGLEPAPAGGRDVLFAAWRIFIEGIAERGTTVLLFEDLHWADAGLLDFIDHILEWSRGMPILVIGVTRPELFDRRPDWGTSHRNATTLTLEPLSESAMREMLDTMVPGLPASAALEILGRADGMPLYAVELIRGLVADGRLERDGNVYRPVGDIREIAVPESLRSLIAARLDALSPAERSLLQDAAVIGQTFVAGALAAVAQRTPEELDSPLRALVRREFLTLRMDPRSPERGQYAFVQALTREVAYGTLGRRDRRSRHLAAARYFEALGDDELAGVLAAHYVAAYEASSEGPEQDAVGVQARLALRSAAERADALGSHDHAIEYLERATALTTDQNELGDLQTRAAESAMAAAREEASRRFARGAITAYSNAGNLPAVGHATAVLAHALLDAGDLAAAIEALEPGIADAARLGEADVVTELQATLSRAFMRMARFADAVALADQALAYAERNDLEKLVVEAFINKGSSLADLGRRREAGGILELAIALAERNGWVSMELRARNNLATIVGNDGPQRAAEVAFAGARLAERFGQRGNLFWTLGTGCFFEFETGEDWDALLARIDDALASDPPPYERHRLLSSRMNVLVARGQATAAELDAFRTLAEGVDDPTYIAAVRLVDADVLMLANRPVEAADLFATIARDVSNDAWFPLLGAARAATWAGDLQRARIAVAELDKLLNAGPWITAQRKTYRAGIAAMEGRTADAIADYLAATRLLTEVGANWDRVRTTVDAAISLGPVPELREVYAWSHERLERLGAEPWLAAMDRGLASRATSRERRELGVDATARV